MKSSLVTENGRRTKTNPDQNSIISYSSCKSCLSSERKTQVKATCKVLWEMREDHTSKLAVKFTQLQIVLATQSIIQVISKFKSAKLQTYFWILLQDRKITQQSTQNRSIESISLPQVVQDQSYMQIQLKTISKQRHHSQTSSIQILMQVLNQLKQKQQSTLFSIMNQHHKLYKGTLILFKFIKKHHHKQQFSSFLSIMQHNQNFENCNSLEISEQCFDLSKLQEKQKQCSNVDNISTKEQLAIKFASTTLLTSLLNEKYRKTNIYFFLNFLRCQQVKSQFIRDLNLSKGIEVSQVNYDQSSLQENQQTVAAQNLHSFLFIKLQNYFQAIKIFHFNNDQQIVEAMNTMIINKNCDLSNSFEDFNTQRVFVANLKLKENEDVGGDHKQISSLQNITDIEESTTEAIPEFQPMEQSMKRKKKKNQNNKIKNAIKSYCNVQQHKRLSHENVLKVDNFGLINEQEVKKEQNYNKLCTPYLLIVVMTLLLILFLK